ncbi:MAG: hypothetical protein KAR06_00815, partial [Deltaproteobacteria bacterium]|nr:hypothetical protein [Deltaproteobacteria bacterium]
MIRYILITILFAVFVATPTKAMAGWAFEYSLGATYNFALPLHIELDNAPDIHESNAKYRFDDFEEPYYYSIRLAKWNEAKAWEVELIHQKLAWDTDLPEVTKFEVSHGFNGLFLNRVYDKNGYVLRLGAGVVIAHPESTINGNHYESEGMGFMLGGAIMQVSVQKKFSLS